jgi:hypothetical protein
MPRSSQWSLPRIKESVLKFLNNEGYMPTADDYDACPYLPNARYIQRNHGGLVKLRKDLALEGPTDFTTGAFRSNVAAKIYANSRVYEEEFYLYLIGILPEIRVHEQKRLRPGNIASDFFVYTTDTDGFAIDLFYAENVKNIGKIITIKRKRYDQLTHIPIFFVVTNENISQAEVDHMLSNKKIMMLNHIKVFTEKYFKENFEQIVLEGKQYFPVT